MSKSQHVFVHVPRTGGSSAWHYLAHLCAGTHNVLDLHHEALTRFGHERFQLTALAVFMGEITQLDQAFLIHHHGVAPCNSMLPNACYYTILRRPVERLLSYYQHVKAMQTAGLRTNEPLIGSRSVLEFYKDAPWHLREYALWFGAMLLQNMGVYPKSQLLNLIKPIPELITRIEDDPIAFVGQVVDFVSVSFDSIAFFENFSPSVKLLARQIGVRTILPPLPHMNSVSRDVITAEDYTSLSALCKIDTMIYERIRTTVGAYGLDEPAVESM